ncbi:MAG: DUF2520 domain-containing protein [Xanthomonadales bacterium]|nr:DUF2520 domain-containing protein [Xanthomonadales bacterium]
MSSRIPLVHCLGCGRAGRSLLRLLADAELVQVGYVVNRSLHSAQQAVSFIGAGCAADALPVLGQNDGLLIALPESQLESAAEAIQIKQSQASGSQALGFAFHLSASQSSELLQGVAERVASLHPAMAFADPKQAITQFAGSWCVLEGDASLCQQLSRWVECLAARAIVATQLDKTLYHAAAMGASNLILATLGLAQRVAQVAGVPEESSTGLLSALALRNVAATQEQGVTAAFTGPVERGDVRAVSRLMQAVSQADALSASDRQLWQQLLRACLPLVAQQGRLSTEQLQTMAASMDQQTTPTRSDH